MVVALMYHVVPKIDIVKQVTLTQSEILARENYLCNLSSENKLMYVFGDRAFTKSFASRTCSSRG